MENGNSRLTIETNHTFLFLSVSMSIIEKMRNLRPAILPSMLQNDFSNIENECERLKNAGAKILHLDVMDGTFVPNISYGLPIVSAFRKSTDLFLDCHLMIDQPEKYISQFAAAGADLITIHVEATSKIEECIALIQETGCGVGLALNPDTPVDVLDSLSTRCDLILVMSVHAGFGGQSFIEKSIQRIEQVRQLDGDFIVEVDGGINRSTVGRCAQVGVDWFVAGSAIFGQEDYAAAISELLSLAAIKENA